VNRLQNREINPKMRHMSKEKTLQGIEWLNPKNFIPILAPDLTNGKNEEDRETVYEEIQEIKAFAITMVRYSISNNPRDYEALNINSFEPLINPRTNKPFTFDDIGIDREKCVGSTAGVSGREEMVARTTIALYRKLQEYNVS
jgi:hypothetical protein